MVLKRVRTILLWLAGIVFVAFAGLRLFGPALVEDSLNRQIFFEDQELSAQAKALNDSLTLVDWHTDTLLWSRNILDRSERGHADVPRLREAGFDLMMFTAVTKSPRGQNVSENTGDTDNITPLVISQGWPTRTWGSLLERALYQAERLDRAVSRAPEALQWVRNKGELEAVLARQGKEGPLGALLGAEGSHPLEGELENIDRMFEAGYRMMGITHFFDNALGGSLHGTEKGGLSDFGRAAIARFDELEMIIDLAHVSEAGAWEILELSNRAHVVSHTGFRGHCDSERNFPDALMQAIAAKGGLIAVGYWEMAICEPTPEGIADAIAYGIELVGEDHVALGSDWDGSTNSITATDFPLITQALLARGVPEATIRKVAGENSVAFLRRWLPD